MILDSQEVFSAAQAVTATGDTPSTNSYDTGSTADVGIGGGLWLIAQVNTAATSGGSATIQAVLQTSVDNSTWTDVVSGPVVAVASATAGAIIATLGLPVGLKRYIRVAWRIGTAVLTAGTFSAFFVRNIQLQQYGAKRFTVDV